MCDDLTTRHSAEKRLVMHASHTYAQTNLQLYAQLRGLGYTNAKLGDVKRAYELAIQLFTGRYRANGKPFISHLVGTASILAAHGASIEVVVAGMLHATYLQGQFGDSQIGVTPARAKVLRRGAGDEAAKLIEEYSRLPWNGKVFNEWLREPRRMTSYNRGVILMRLANDLEDHLDHGMLYCNKAEKTRVMDTEAQPMPAQIAQELGYRALAAELAEAYAADAAAQIPEALRFQHTASFTVAVHQSGLWARLAKRLRRLGRRLSN